MYNRYVPQSDGSYRKNRVQEPRNESVITPTKVEFPQQTCQPESPCSTTSLSGINHGSTPHGTNVASFLRQLLPKDFDTEDLLVILLLLLMSGDGKENKNTALLTLALYLFM